VSPTEGGKIIVSPQTPNYKEGEVVTFTPEPNEHWVFKQWEGDGTGSSTPLQLTMSANKSVVGVFVKRDYPLTITIEGEGTVEERIVPNPGGREYPHGTTVELTPKPKEGWVFDSWGGDLSGTDSPKTIKVDKAKNVTVKFKRRDYPLNITITGEGTVEEKIITNPGGRSYPFETVVLLTPKPSEGWVFESWGGDLTGTQTPKTIKVDKEKNVTVKFKINTNFYLNANGLTCMCPNAQVGEIGFINGVRYEAVDNILIKTRVGQGADLTKLCTSKVTNMVLLFGGNMQFNQPIGNWDVSNVTNMSGMFTNSSFNQPIGNWDVSNVFNMSNMFGGSKFNQPLDKWNVKKVVNMTLMFYNSPFNQNISTWCVTYFTSEPELFSTNSPLTEANKPKWWTCPG
jgi:uncharacterized repeat protein (TIGR02543 family)